MARDEAEVLQWQDGDRQRNSTEVVESRRAGRTQRSLTCCLLQDTCCALAGDWLSEPDKALRTTVTLREPRGGIVAAVTIINDFVSEPHYWHDLGAEARLLFIGYFAGSTLLEMNTTIPLDVIKRYWMKFLGKDFNPRINGGVRKLAPEEGALLKRLCGLV